MWRSVLLSLTALLLLSSCGIKGPLYLEPSTRPAGGAQAPSQPVLEAPEGLPPAPNDND